MKASGKSLSEIRRTVLAASFAAFALLCAAAGVIASLLLADAYGLDAIGRGTPGGTASSVLILGSVAFSTLSVIFGVISSTPPRTPTSWLRVGRAALLVWAIAIMLMLSGILLARVFGNAGVAAGIPLTIAAMTPVVLLPSLLMLPIWTLIAAIRNPRPAKIHSYPNPYPSTGAPPTFVAGDKISFDSGQSPHQETNNGSTTPPNRSNKWRWISITGVAIIVALIVGLVAVPVPQSEVSAATGYTSEITELNGIGGYLREEHLYADPQAELQLTPQQQQSLSNFIDEYQVPIYVAVLPQSLSVKAGGPSQLLNEIMKTVGEDGVYLVASHYTAQVGFTAGYEEAGQIYSAVLNVNSFYGTLSAFIAQVNAKYDGI